MKRKKIPAVGNITFGSKEAYDNFLSLPHKDQVEQVYESLSPKDYVLAEKILKDGNISSGNATAAKPGSNGNTGGGGGSDTTKSAGSTSEKGGVSNGK